MKIVHGEIKKQEAEIEDIKLFSLTALPSVLAFEHAQMIKDFVAIRNAKAKKVNRA